MDTQMKKGVLEVCILASLNRQDNYGYLLLKDINRIIEMSESTLYPILKRLEKNKYLTTYSVAFEGRLRKYYKITEEGKKKLENFLEDWEEIVNVYEFIKGGKNYE